jgi:uncharacterized glyoxalase superfamily protein PhnB
MLSVDRLVPVLVYRDIAAAHDFLVRAFGFEAGGVHRDERGEAVHGEVRIGDQALWLHRVSPDHQLDSPNTIGVAGGGFVVHVSDVDVHFARAREAGAQIQFAPIDQPYGQREYEARDPEGHRWWFATPESAMADL